MRTLSYPPSRTELLVQILVPMGLGLGFLFAGRLGSVSTSVILLRALAILTLGIWFWGRTQKKAREIGKPVASPLPIDPVEIMSALKTLQTGEPHCLWAGHLGQLWGVRLKGHSPELPFAQQGREVWLLHLDGDKVVVDVGRLARPLEKGNWIKLPKGIGAAGMKSDNAIVAWIVRP